MRFLFSKQSPRFNYSLSKCLLKTLIFFPYCFPAWRILNQPLLLSCFWSVHKKNRCGKLQTQIVPKQYLLPLLSPSSVFLLNNNISLCIQRTSGLLPNSRRGSFLALTNHPASRHPPNPQPPTQPQKSKNGWVWPVCNPDP